MTTQEAVEVLEQYNKWRRGAEIEMPDPKRIGEAINVAINALKEINKNSNNLNNDIMATKFTTLGDSKKTVFKTLLDGSFKIVDASEQPENYSNVLFLGHDESYGDLFKAWNDDKNNFAIYFGEKGDEFND